MRGLKSMKRTMSRSHSMTGGNQMFKLEPSPVSLSGGRRHRRHRRHRRSRGGSRTRKHSRKQRGGFLDGVGLAATIKEALVPFGLFALQKRTQRRRKY